MSEVVIDEAGFRTVRTGIGKGLLFIGYHVEGEAKAITPVYGDPSQGGKFKTRAPGAKPQGGNLRRSIHTVCYIDGKPALGTGGGDENGNAVPAYPVDADIEVFVGTNAEYAVFVHDGTTVMTGRPFLAEAEAASAGDWPELFRRGFESVVK